MGCLGNLEFGVRTHALLLKVLVLFGLGVFRKSALYTMVFSKCFEYQAGIQQGATI